MNLPNWAKVAIQFLWTALSSLLTTVGVPAVVIAAVQTVLVQLGLLNGLGGEQLSHEQVEARAKAILEHANTTVGAMK